LVSSRPACPRRDHDRLIVPVLGGGIAYLFLGRQFGPMKTVADDDHRRPQPRGERPEE